MDPGRIEIKMLIQFMNHAHKPTLQEEDSSNDMKSPFPHRRYHQTGTCPIIGSDVIPETLGLGIGPVCVGGDGGSSSKC